jgi:integrase/recombinase XerD
MKTSNSFSINFFLKKGKLDKGNAPIYVRITVNGKFVDISLKRRVSINKCMGSGVSKAESQ